MCQKNNYLSLTKITFCSYPRDDIKCPCSYIVRPVTLHHFTSVMSLVYAVVHLVRLAN